MTFSTEKFSGIVGVLRLLDNLSVPKMDTKLQDTLETWTCGSCEEFVDDCVCYQEEYNAGFYDDEASFE